jgi:hypothetical protein
VEFIIFYPGGLVNHCTCTVWGLYKLTFQEKVKKRSTDYSYASLCLSILLMYNHHVSHYIFEQGEAEFAYLTPFFN